MKFCLLFLRTRGGIVQKKKGRRVAKYKADQSPAHAIYSLLIQAQIGSLIAASFNLYQSSMHQQVIQVQRRHGDHSSKPQAMASIHEKQPTVPLSSPVKNFMHCFIIRKQSIYVGCRQNQTPCSSPTGQNQTQHLPGQRFLCISSLRDPCR